jgi:hypothetical protein
MPAIALLLLLFTTSLAQAETWKIEGAEQFAQALQQLQQVGGLEPIYQRWQ